MKKSSSSLPSSGRVITTSSLHQLSSPLAGEDDSSFGASPEFLKALAATSKEVLTPGAKSRCSSLPPPTAKSSRSSSDAMVVHTTSGVMAPSPPDSNVQVSSTLSERDSRIPCSEPPCLFAYTNPYTSKKGLQAPRASLPPSCVASLSFTHSLRQKGLEVPPASM